MWGKGESTVWIKGERDGRFLVPYKLEIESFDDGTVDWMGTGALDVNYFRRGLLGDRDSCTQSPWFIPLEFCVPWLVLFVCFLVISNY